MEFFIKVIIYIHAFFGGLGLFSGLASMYFRKGRSRHRNTGHIFSVSMIISSSLSLIIAVLPNHQNAFLFLIGLFTIYKIIAGNRALTFKNSDKIKADLFDRIVSTFMLIASLIMMIFGVFKIDRIEEALLYFFFAAFGLFLSINDFRNFKRFKKEKLGWLKSHIGRMVGALIASFTAFIVTGLQLNEVIYWISPTIVGTIIIIYWSNKVEKRKFYRRQL
jgi:uncharacterized membrane protein